MNTHSLIQYVKGHYKALLALGFSIVLTLALGSYIIIERERDRMFSAHEIVAITAENDIRVGIVFGGAVLDDAPLPLVQDRLDTAAHLLEDGVVQKLLVSGDNRSLEYNEPRVMYNYLVDEKGIDPDLLQPDFAGRSTYETCERAKKVFSLQTAILITESTHLPRALYLCQHFGIDAYGVKSDGEASRSFQPDSQLRETLARTKAMFNVYIYGEQTILGEQIQL